MTDLGVVEGFEERSDADQTNLVVPHDTVLTVVGVPRNVEDVLEDWFIVSAML